MPDRNAAPTITRRVVVHGLVQGVSYRASAAAEATRLGIDGWVRNRTDGTVEAVLQGPAVVIDNFVAWARQGPPAARVSRVEVDAADTPVEAGFRIRRDGT